MWQPGVRIGKYKLVERLGRGGMAETWRADLHAAAGVRRPVVIKRVLPSFADNADFVGAFIQEAKLTAQLSHGNIAQIFDFGKLEDGSHFIAMELIDGVSLDRVLKRGISRGYWHMPYAIAGLVALEVAKGLEHVHTRRGAKGQLDIVHRDISPDNIIVGLNGETKLVDFGVAKSVLEGRPETEAGVIKGKYIYFSPEQAAGERVDFRTDLYALGVVLYRLLTGKKAFDGPGLKVLIQVQKGDYVPLRVANPGVPDELATVVETMMARRKEDRFANTLELVEALQSAVHTLAPRAGVHWIRGWIRWLYSTELQKRGESPDLAPGFADLIEGWLPQPRPEEISEHVLSAENHNPMGTVASRPAARGRGSVPSAVVEPFEWTKKRKLLAGAALTGAGLVFGAFMAATWNHDPNEGESDTERATRIADATSLKPLGPGGRPGPVAVPAELPDEPAAVEPEPVAKSAPPPAPATEVTYDAEKAPVKFTLGPAHRVLIDQVAPLPAASGNLSELKPVSKGALGAQIKLAGSLEFRMPDMAASGDAASAGLVPPLLFTPGLKPILEVALGRAKWSGPESRVFVVVGTASEIPPYTPFQVDVNGKPTLPSGWLVVVDTNDRFTVRDLSSRTTWKVTVKPRPGSGSTVAAPVLLVASGETVRLDGKKLPGGYGVLAAGKHQLSGATSAWLTMPALSSMELAEVDLTIEP